jgi:hypothetical protein
VRPLHSTSRRTVLAAVVPVGLVLGAAVVWQSTEAAFSASTDNPGNTWQAGTVVLGDSGSGAALFTSPDDDALRPGSTRSRCIRVDYTGSLAADIRFYATTPAAGATSLDPFLVMSVERGRDVPAGTTVEADCSAGYAPSGTPAFVYNDRSAGDPAARQDATMADLKTHGDYATGIPVGTAVPEDTHLTFRITYLVKDDNAAQGSTSSATFVWEAQNTPGP